MNVVNVPKGKVKCFVKFRYTKDDKTYCTPPTNVHNVHTYTEQGRTAQKMATGRGIEAILRSKRLVFSEHLNISECLYEIDVYNCPVW